VHIGGGIVPDIANIADFCRARGLWLVEDAAHAHGASFLGRAAGTFGIASAFSFYPTKVMTTAEGGMIVTDDDRIDAEARIYRDQGKAGFTANIHTRLGYNWRMSEIHAAIGRTQLRRLQDFIAARRKVATIYDEGLAGLPALTPLPEPANACGNYYKYIALLGDGVDRATLKKTLRERHGVGLTGEVYELPCHAQPVFASIAAGEYPGADHACASHVCLPMSARMTADDAAHVVRAVRATLGA